MENEHRILEDVLEEFGKLAAIPRKSGHEKAASDYLAARLRELGLTAVQDEAFNVIASVPATPGKENAPRTILQAHMDMVCVAAEGVAYDPLKDPIRVRRDGGFLMAEGTSLGADDGIGIALILCLLRHAGEHGPLRVIFTVDEEQGMSGAVRLDPAHLQDADFLVNCDSENLDELIVGCAGSLNIDFSRRIQEVPSELPHGYRIAVSGLRGGHSGERIGDGRGNAIRTMALLLQELVRRGAAEIASLEGGTARNVIPDTTTAEVATRLSPAEIQECARECRRRFLAIYGAADPGIRIDCVPLDAPPPKVLEHEGAKRLLQLLAILHTGVYAMSRDIPGLVETSANLGTVATAGGLAEVRFFPRSAVDEKVDEFRRLAEDVAGLTGFSVHLGSQTPGWKELPGSRLAALMGGIFEEQNHRPMQVKTIHAGLECGWHFRKNPGLDIVSVGVTTLDIHSPKERLQLDTVEPEALLLQETLRRIAQMQPSAAGNTERRV